MVRNITRGPDHWPLQDHLRLNGLQGGEPGAFCSGAGERVATGRERGEKPTSYHQHEPYQHSEKVERNLSADWLPSSRLTTLLTQ